MPLERELKYSLLDPYVPDLTELRSALAEASLPGASWGAAAAPAEDLVDTYFDDDAGALRAAGWALRTRRSGASTVATLKAAGETDGAMHRREELELPLAADAGGGVPWPDEVRARLAGVVDAADLRPRLELRSTRVRFHILKSGVEAAMLSFDSVEARVPGSERSALFDEVEVEAAGDTSDAELQSVGDAVDRLVRLTPSTVTKLERAEALLMLADW